MNPFTKWFSNAFVGMAAFVLLTSTASGQNAPSPSRDAIESKTKEVFERKEFQPPNYSKLSESWLFRQILAFFQWLSHFFAIAPVISWIIVGIIVLLLIALIVFIAFQVRGAFVDGGRGRKSSTPADRIRLSGTYRDQAKRFANAGDYTEAIRYLFLSLIYRFDERGRVSFHKEYTNREYLEFMNERQVVRDALQLIVDILDDHWYGLRPCLKQQYDECLAVYERLAA